MTIIVTGSVAFDYLMTFPGRFREQILPEHLNKLSVSFLVDSKESFWGGTGPNIAYSLALLGNQPKLFAAAGKDFGEFGGWLEAQGVDTSAMGIFQDEFTATFSVITDLDHNQIASFHTGAMARARELSLRQLDGEAIDLVIISPNDPEAMRKYAQECRDLGIPFVYDPSQQLARMDGPVLLESMAGARVLTVNEYEYEMVRQKSGLDEAGLLALVDSIVVTLGAQGSKVINRGFEMLIPAASTAHVVEPTGVGDAYRAGLLTGLVRGYPWEVTCRLASLAATYVIEQHGTMSHRYDLPGFVARYRQEFGDTPELNDLLTCATPSA
ncbi:MAG TPA: carbohydrate kinase family protein [Anaerolineae bacterium]|nr:carbohydrate kinase family protein [Anaerolineae bacterium]